MRGLIVAAVLLAVGLAVAPARAEGEYVGTYRNWETRVYAAEGQTSGRRCAARAFHPAITEGEVFWVVNTARLDDRPLGYLAVDPRLMIDAAAARVRIDDGPIYLLDAAPDGWGYNRRDDAEVLFAGMREGLEMTVEVDRGDAPVRRLTLSLLGFTLASRAARQACGLPEDPA